MVAGIYARRVVQAGCVACVWCRLDLFLSDVSTTWLPAVVSGIL